MSVGEEMSSPEVLYTAGVHRVSDISIIHLFVVMCHCATSEPSSSLCPPSSSSPGFRLPRHLASSFIVPGFANFSCLYCTLIRGLCANNWPVQSGCCKIWNKRGSKGQPPLCGGLGASPMLFFSRARRAQRNFVTALPVQFSTIDANSHDIDSYSLVN